MQVKNGHMRWCEMTGQWIIYAPGRGDRPHDASPMDVQEDAQPLIDATCPFCPGNEDQLLDIHLEMPGVKPDAWRTRMVPNKYPALTRTVGAEIADSEPFQCMSTYGIHDVLIESPEHTQDLPDMSCDQLCSIWATCAVHARHLLDTDSQLQALLFFRNHGTRAGTSLNHPHSQLIGTSIIPQALRRRELLVKEYHQLHGRCFLCDLMQIEQRQQVRMIEDNQAFVAFVPFAASVPYEMWIVPRQHDRDFMRIARVQQEALSRILRRVLRSLRDKLGDPHYNMIFHLPSRVESGSPCNHWFLQIRPRMTTPAGFEIGSGMTINPSLPENDAKRLRE